MKPTIDMVAKWIVGIRRSHLPALVAPPGESCCRVRVMLIIRGMMVMDTYKDMGDAFGPGSFSIPLTKRCQGYSKRSLSQNHRVAEFED